MATISPRTRFNNQKQQALFLLFVTFVFFVVNSSPAHAQTVTNVRAGQRGDGSRLVDIYYDLAHNTACTVWPVLSGDGGVSWSVPAMTLTGDLAPGVAPGTNRHIIWDAAADIPGVVGTYRARVYADDGASSSNMVLVPGGTFPYQGNVSQQTFVGSFSIDKYEMTNQRYAEFLNDADPDGTHWNASMEITRSGTPPSVYYAINPGRSNYPIRFVSAIDAEAYAAWLSAREGRTYRLPTEQEWEKAASWDPTINKRWAFGYQSDSISCASANAPGQYNGSFYPPCVGSATEVGHYNGTGGTNDAKSFYGCYDMSGNVWEWTSSTDSMPTYNCLPGPSRVVRGGGYGNYPVGTTGRCYWWCGGPGGSCEGLLPAARLGDVGFRLVMDPN